MEDQIVWYQDYGMLAAVAQVLVAIVLALITWRYVLLTEELVKEARRARRPHVFAELRNDHVRHVFLVVGNRGPGTARDVQFHIDYDFGSRSVAAIPQVTPTLSALPWANSGFEVLGPTEEHFYSLRVPGPNEVRFPEAMKARLSVRYQSFDYPDPRNPYCDVFELDAAALPRGGEFVPPTAVACLMDLNAIIAQMGVSLRRSEGKNGNNGPE
ncbi:MAG: hypothetical protein ACYC63_03815 [Armatimonadota bacterium]